MPTQIRVTRWLAGPFIVLAMTVSVFSTHTLPLAALAVAVAILPSTYAVELPSSSRARPYAVRAMLIAISGVAVAAILLVEHSTLPTWFLVVVAVYGALDLPLLTLNLFLVYRPEIRRRLEQARRRRLQRGCDRGSYQG